MEYRCCLCANTTSIRQLMDSARHHLFAGPWRILTNVHTLCIIHLLLQREVFFSSESQKRYSHTHARCTCKNILLTAHVHSCLGFVFLSFDSLLLLTTKGSRHFTRFRQTKRRLVPLFFPSLRSVHARDRTLQHSLSRRPPWFEPDST